MKKLLLLSFLLLCVRTGFGQSLSDYSFTAVTGLYSSLGSGSTTPALTFGDYDNGYYNSIPIGFTFTYAGNNYTFLSASTNGWVALGQLIDSSRPRNDLANAFGEETPRPILAPLWDDLISSSANLKYITTGSGTSHIFTIEWSKCDYYADYAGGGFTVKPVINFQLKLYETSNKIEFIYKNDSFSYPSASSSIGISSDTGASVTGTVPFISLVGATALPVTDTAVEDTAITTQPATGQIYRFTLCSITASASNNGPGCMNGSVNLTGTTSDTSGTPIYSWSGPGGFSASSADTTIDHLGPPSAGVYTLTISDGGCTATDTTVVSINPVVSISTSDSTSFCMGGSALLVPDTGFGYTYQWLDGSAIIAGATDSVYTADTSGTYSLIVNFGSCSDTTSPIHITSVPPPTATISYVGSLSFCSGGTVLLKSGSLPGVHYQWLSDTGAIAGATDSVRVVNASGNYRVVVTNSGGCSDTSSSLTVTVTTAPSAAISPTGPTFVCSGGTLLLTATSDTGYTYQWLRGGHVITGATDSTYLADTSGIYSVVISNGCVDTSSGVVLIESPVPTASFTVHGPTSFCGGDSSKLAASTAAGYTYQWMANDTLITGATDSIYFASVSGNYQLIVTNAAGCTDTSSATTITVTPFPSGTISPAGPFAFCAGGSVTLSVDTGTGYSYQWYKSGSVISGATTSSYTADSSGAYTAAISNGGCATTTDSVSVTVYAVPKALVSVSGTTTFCLGGSVTFTAFTDPSYTYQWLSDDTAISGATDTAYTATVSGSYQLVVSNSAGCSDTSLVTNVISSIPGSSVITPSGSVAICAGSSVTFSTPSGAGFTYEWMKDSVIIPGATDSTYAADTVGNYSVIVNNGCIDTTSAVSVSINPIPSAVATPLGVTIFCTGDSVVIAATTNPSYTYEWLRNDTLISGATDTTYTAYTSANYQLVTMFSTGCTDTSIAVSVAVAPLPTSVISPAGPISICAGSGVDLTASTGFGYTYTWFRNDTLISGATTNVYTADTTGDYTVVVYAGTCPDTSAPVTVNVVALPVATVSPTGPTSFCMGDSVVLSAGASSAGVYQWLKDGVVIPGATDTTYTADSTGDYSVYVINSSGCVDTSSAVTVTVNSLPVATITPSGSVSICFGSSLTLNATAGAGYTYQWMLNDTAISGATDASYTATTGGAYNVTITNGSGCSATSAYDTFTVHTPPSASISSPGADTICSGGFVVLNVTSLDTGLTYQWFNGATVLPGVTTAGYAATVTGNYSAVVTNANGCTDTTASVHVLVHPLPVGTISSSGPDTFCLGGSVTLTANDTATGDTFQWHKDGVDIAGATSQSYTADSTGNYSVTITSMYGCTTTSLVKLVSVVSRPVATITSPGADTVCYGAFVVLNAPVDATYFYQWYKDGAALPGATTYTLAATSTGTYSVVITNGSGCSDTSAGVSVLVNPLPASAISPAGPDTICPGSSITLHGLVTSVSYHFQWQLGGSSISGATDSTYSATLPGSYTLVETSAAGCTTTSSAVIVAVDTPVATITASGSTSICSGTFVTLNGNIVPGYTYQWQLGGTNIPGATDPTYNAGTGGDYTLVTTNGTGCSATSSAITVTVLPLPNDTITASGPITFCAGDSVTLDVPTVSGYIYQWQQAGTDIPGATNASITINSSGDYTVRIISTNGCSDTSTTTTVTVNSLPGATISVTGPTTVCTGGTITLNANTATGLTYQWYRDGFIISGATDASYVASVTGNYIVVVTNASGCSSTSAPVTIQILPMPVVAPQNPTSFCWGSACVLDAVSGALSGTVVTYQWQKDGLDIPGATDSVYTAYHSGDYTCIVNYVGTCINTATAVTIIEHDLAHPDITYGGGYLNTEAYFVTYQWNKDGANISGATSYSTPEIGLGDYQVTVTDTNGCIGVSEIYVLTDLAVQNTNMPDVKIYPNPATATIHISSPVAVNVDVCAFDGKMLIQQKNATDIEIGSLADGVYIVTVRNQAGQVIKVQKLIKAAN